MAASDLNNTESFSDSFIADAIVDMPEDDYRNVETLYVSRRGFCEIHKVVKGGKWYVAKCLKPSLHDNIAMQMLLEKEYEIGSRLDHGSICRTIDYTTVKQLGLSVIMEYVDGQPLRQYIEENKITEPLLRKWCIQICDALVHTHSRQIIHRDLKPENILITDNGQNVKIIDFGYSDTDDSAIFKQPAGTLRYIAPEQLDENRKEDQRADIYSFGVMLDEILSSCRLRSSQLRRISKKCSKSNADDRYHDANEVLEALEIKKRNTGIYLLASLFVVVAFILFFFLKPKAKTEYIKVESTEKPSRLPTFDEQSKMFSELNPEVSHEENEK